jgi:hypothetical protein
MIRGRQSSDNWARIAHLVLDKARAGHGSAEHIDWALSYLGDKDGSTKIPRDLMGSQSRAVPA